MQSGSPTRNIATLGWSLHAGGAMIALAILGAATLLAYGPAMREAAACRQRAALLRTALRGEADVRAEDARLQDELVEAKRQETELKDRIPEQPREADFLAQVSGLADRSGLTIRDYRPGNITTRPAYSAMRVELVCQGNYESLCNFVQGLAEIPRHSTVVHLTILNDTGLNNASSKDGRAKDKKYAVKMSLELYFAVRGNSPDDGRSKARA